MLFIENLKDFFIILSILYIYIDITIFKNLWDESNITKEKTNENQ